MDQILTVKHDVLIGGEKGRECGIEPGCIGNSGDMCPLAVGGGLLTGRIARARRAVHDATDADPHLLGMRHLGGRLLVIERERAG